MTKEFTAKEKGMIKNTAKTVYPMYAKLYKLEEKLHDLQLEIEAQRNTINTWEAGVMNLTGGYTSMELCDRELIQVGTDDKGKAINKANFKLRYETVIPPENITPQPINPEPVNPEVIATTDNMNPIN